jgi:HEPN domain-containing protein
MEFLRQIEYWVEISNDDLKSAESIFINGNYDWSLFIAHLALEKILKAYYVSVMNDIPPKTHKLDRIAELSGLQLTVEQDEFLRVVNEFNLEARYPDYKKKFKDICTKEFANKYLAEIKQLHQWIQNQIQKQKS